MRDGHGGGNINRYVKAALKRPQVFWVAGIALVYIITTVVLSQFYITAKYIPQYFSAINWHEFAVSIVLTLLIAVFVGLNAVIGFSKYQERKAVKGHTAMTCAATIGGIATGVCPACVAGVFPLAMSALGLAFSWAALPFKGLEVQAVIALVLGIVLYVQ